LAVGICLVSSAPLFSQHGREKESDDGGTQRERAEWFLHQRVYPGTQIPPGARLNALRQLEHLRALDLQHPHALSATQWTNIGPRGVNEEGVLFSNGRVGAMAIDPRSVGDGHDIVYVGGSDGGIWKTTDSGATWTPVADNQPSLSIGALAVDPSTPTTVYAGTGDHNLYPGVGILKSTDGGQTWTSIVGPFNDQQITGLAINPANTKIILASSVQGGIYRSADAGQTWTVALAASADAVYFGQGGTVAYAAVAPGYGFKTGGLYKSADGGATWSAALGTGATALPAPSSMVWARMAVAPSDLNTVYLGFENSTGGLLGLYKTVDGGQTWNQLGRVLDYCNPQCGYSHYLSVHPTNPNIVFAGGIGLYRSIDGGTTWTDAINENLGANGVDTHVDQQAMVWTPNGATFYFGNDGGVYSTSSASQPVINFTNLNGNLTLTQYYPGLAIHPTNINQAIGGTQDNGMERYNGSAVTEWVTCGDGGWAVYDPANSSTIYAACIRGDVRRSTDGGDTWTQVGNNIPPGVTNFIAPLVIDQNSRVYFGTDTVLQTTDGGNTWNRISPAIGNGTPITSLAVSPNNANTIIAGTFQGKVYITTNASTWNDKTGTLPGRSVTQVIADPSNVTTFYVLYSGFSSVTPSTPGHVFRSQDSGATWKSIDGNLPDIPADDLAVDPDIANTLYLATDLGVFVSSNGGTSWSSLGSGFPNVAVMGLKLHRQSRTLRAATYGRGLWDLSVPCSGQNPPPSITAISPAIQTAGSPAFALTVTGSGFGPGSVVQWNGASRVTTGTGTQLSAAITAADIATAGTASVTVFMPAPGGGVSNPFVFVTGATNPTPTVTSISPGTVNAGSGPATITVNGTNFLAGAAVQWNGAPHAYALVNPTRLQIAATAADLASAGSANITVTNPTPGGGTSNALTLFVTNPRAGVEIAGSPWLYPASTIAATSAPLGAVQKVNFDNAGNLLVPDTSNCLVYRLNVASGNLNTIAGTGNCVGGGLYRLTGPAQAVSDSKGNVYILDQFSFRVVKLNSDTSMTTVVGGAQGFDVGDGGPATSASLSVSESLAFDSAGNLYISDTNAYRIRKVDPSGIITTIAGTGTPGYSGDGGPAISAQINFVQSLAIDSAGNLLFADTDNNCVRKIDAGGKISTVAGQCGQTKSGSTGDGGPATSALFAQPKGIALDSAGDLYIADTGNSRIRRVDASSGLITTVAGTGVLSFSGDGGTATKAALNRPQGVAIDSSGNLWIADSGNYRVRMVAAASGQINTVVGNGGFKFAGDGGPATNANFNGPQGVAVDAAGNVYVADTSNHRIRKITTDGVVRTIAGNGTPGFSGDGGPAVNAALSSPQNLVVDPQGNVYIADSGNDRVRRVGTDGNISTFAGGGASPNDGQAATAAFLAGFQSALFHDGTNLYIGDNSRLRIVTPDGKINTVAGSFSGFQSTGDGGPATKAGIAGVAGITMDGSGNIFLATNHSVRRIGTDGIINTVAGTGVLGPDFQPQIAPPAILATSTADLQGPFGLAADGAGNVAISDDAGVINRVYELSPVGSFTTLASGADTTIGARVLSPHGLAVDGAGNLYIADTGNDRILKIPGAMASVPLPVAPNNGIVNGASFAPSAAVSPWSIASLFGSNLASRTTGATTLPLPTSLGGTSVVVNGAPAPLFFTSTGQINFQVPVEATGTSATVAVSSRGAVGNSVTLAIAPAAPGIFTADSSGRGQAALLNQDSSPNSATNPAAAGSVLQIFATGLGATSPAVATGKPGASSAPFNQTTTTPVVLFNGTPSPSVQFSAAAPGFVGLYQVNAVIPLGTASGTVTLQIQIGGATSNTATIAVK